MVKSRSFWNIEKCEWEYPGEYIIYQNCLSLVIDSVERIRRVLIDECVVQSEFVPEALETLGALERLIEKAAQKTKQEYESEKESNNS